MTDQEFFQKCDNLERRIKQLEARVGEAEHIIPSEVLESAIEYLKDYEDMKVAESWRKFPEVMGR